MPEETNDLKKTPSVRKQPAPKIARVVISSGIGSLITKKGVSEEVTVNEGVQVLSAITGQKPCLIPARKSVSGFKLRQGMPVGLMVTLRGKRAENFIKRLVGYALPRDKNFSRIQRKNIDAAGNLNLGLSDATVFPEAIFDNIKHTFGLGVTIVVSAKKPEQKIELYKALGFPIKL